MKQALRKFSLKIYRQLRHPKHRRTSRVRQWIAGRVLDKALWRPARRTLAVGLAVGLAISMLPPILPQMLIAAVLAMLLRVNVPAAAAGVWFSNPATWLPLMKAQFEIGQWALPAFESPTHLKRTLEIVGTYTMGAILMGVVVVGIGYFAALAIWDWSAWLVVRRKKARDLALLAEAAAAVAAAKREREEAGLAKPEMSGHGGVS